MSFQTLIIERHDGVTLVRLNRPEALNALNSQVFQELGRALDEAETDEQVRCLVLTGSAKAFAAGADIKEMADKTYAEMFVADYFTAGARRFEQFRKPIIAADTAKFGQPEINLGVAPGIGGTQRLTRLVGKSKAMDMILTGRMMDAAEAERSGLVSRVVPADRLIEEALGVAAKIAGLSPLAVMMNKELVEAALATTLAQGVQLVRRLFHSLFAFDDQKEGMAAFVAKRPPDFRGR
jgi:enoyl-CoA hydratase/carnithine racemase